jgi:hypothetical protein
MKKKNILNRAMFRQVKSPAYGTGISANLVSNEERQRYNYGGRVGYYNQGYVTKEGNKIPRQYYEDLDKSQLGPYGYGVSPEYGAYKVKEWDDVSGTEELPGIGELQFEDYYDRNAYQPYKVGTASLDAGVVGAPTRDIIARGVIAPERKGSFEDLSMQELLKEQAGEKGDVFIDQEGFYKDKLQPTTDEEIIKRKSMIEEGTPSVTDKDDKWKPGVEHSGLPGGIINTDDMPKPIDDKSDTLDIESIVDKYYDKKGSLGAAQLGLAGQILKAGFQPKKDAMGTVGDAMGQFGKDISADKKAFEKLAATGEIQRELYRMSRAEEGKQDRATKAYGVELDEWLKKNGAEEDEISDIKSYTGLMAGWDTSKQGNMTALDHQDYVSRFNPELASSGITMDLVTDKKTQVTGFSEFDLQKFNEAEEGALIFVGNKMYIKNSSVKGSPGNPAGMEKTNYTQLTLSPKKKEKKKFQRYK